MSKAKRGDHVRVHYTGTLEDGTVFDTSRKSQPLQFQLGREHVIPGFDMAIRGMAAGEKKSIHIPVDKAYGQYNPQRKTVVYRSFLPEGVEVTVGRQLELTQADGRINVVTITDISDDVVTLDGNHPLAGRDLFFDLELVEVLPEKQVSSHCFN